MNHKFLLLALLVATLHFAVPNTASTSNNNQAKAVTTNTTENPGLPGLESHHENYAFQGWNKDFFLIDLTHAADDSKFYVFHLERVRKTKWNVRLFIILARIIIVISHLSVLLYAFKGLVNS
jgi:hypothetical protein